MNKYTPGPWMVRDTNSAGNPVGYRVVESTHRGPHGFTPHIATLYTVAGDPEQEANTLLVAAAPELLEALEKILRIEDSNGMAVIGWSDALDQARAAILKARGGGE